eukprot:4277717-Amphidinium_carterae.1
MEYATILVWFLGWYVHASGGVEGAVTVIQAIESMQVGGHSVLRPMPHLCREATKVRSGNFVFAMSQAKRAGVRFPANQTRPCRLRLLY